MDIVNHSAGLIMSCHMLDAEGWLPLRIMSHSPTQLAVYCVFQIDYFVV